MRRRLLALGLWPLAASARAAVDYPDVVPGRELSFPRDEGAHPTFRNEWWYVTGWLRDDDAREYGFQVTFFRNRPGIAEDNPSRFAPRELLFAHAAIADPRAARLRSDQRAAREGFGLAGASTARTDVHIGDWSLVEASDVLPGSVRTGDRYRARVRGRDFALDLALAATSPVMLQGDAGVSRKGPDPTDASYYYSRPQLEVSGTIDIGAGARQVRGIAWLDHEWSSRYLAARAIGWDWTGINLDDGGALMAFRIRDRDGGTLWAGGGRRDVSGSTRSYAPNQVRFVPQQQWRSPRTGIEYPVAMRVEVGDLDLDLLPLMPDQELDARASVGIVYWEGAVHAAIGGRDAGRGYLELTGYGGPLRL
ncbi:MAG: lipocalin-like domain-containing protein [Betaproteobacteria bacterium]